MAFNNLLNMDTTLNTPVGYFGSKMMDYGECHIGESFWIKNGLTLQHKITFEAYQRNCELYNTTRDITTAVNALVEIHRYEKDTLPERRNKIINTMVEINKWYKIGNEMPVSTTFCPICLNHHVNACLKGI